MAVKQRAIHEGLNSKGLCTRGLNTMGVIHVGDYTREVKHKGEWGLYTRRFIYEGYIYKGEIHQCLQYVMNYYYAILQKIMCYCNVKE